MQALLLLSLNENVSEDGKHRTSLGKSTDVLHRKYGCLPQRNPMFLSSHPYRDVPYETFRHSAFLPPPKKKFRKKSYISYTIRRNDQ